MLKKLSIILLILAFATVAYSQADGEGKESFAYIARESVEVRASPKATAPIVITLKQFDLVLLIDTLPNLTWLKIMSLDGKEGWVQTGSIGMVSDKTPELQRVATNVDPVIRLVNKTSTTITLGIAGTKQRIPPKKQKVIRLKPGDYNYTLNLAGFSQGTGTRYFSAGGGYTWTFKIITKRVTR